MRHSRTRDVVIELTSLLDVVMIIIFAVMIQNSKMVETAGQEYQKELANKQGDLNAAESELVNMQAKLDNAAGELAGKQAELDSAMNDLEVAKADLDRLLSSSSADDLELYRLKSANESYEYLSAAVDIINVSLENTNDHTVRVLTYGRDGEQVVKNIKKEEDATEWNKAINDLKYYLDKELDDILENGKSGQEKDTYFIFSYETDKVFETDYLKLDEIVNYLKNKAGENTRTKILKNPISPNAKDENDDEKKENK